MPKTTPKIAPANSQRYLERLSRRWVYTGLALAAVAAAALWLFLPHYKPLHIASTNEISQAHHDIIRDYFVSSTTCSDDTSKKPNQVKTFNTYFEVNKYGNRAVIRGCGNRDTLLAKNDDGDWVRTDVNIGLGRRQNSNWQKACLIDDITKTETIARPENASIDANNLRVCDNLAKQSYIEIRFHF